MPKRPKSNQRTEAANALVETTMASFVPGLTRPLAFIPFTGAERKGLVSRLKSVFPDATDEKIEVAVFGNVRKTVNG